MSTKVIDRRDKNGLIAGMSWQVVTRKGRAREKEIRGLANAAEASKIVVVDTGEFSSVGLFVPTEIVDEADEGEDGRVKVVKPRALHSLAAAFAAFAGDGDSVLFMTLPEVGTLRQAVVIAVGNGRPLTDQIKSLDEAADMAMSYSNGSQGDRYTLYTDNLHALPDGNVVSLDDIWTKVGRKTQLVRTPANVLALMSTATAVMVVAGLGYGYMMYTEAEAKKERQRQAAIANPTPKYVSALRSKIGQLGAGQATVLAILAHMRQQPIFIEGWSLSKVACTVEPARCTSTWERAGGTTDRLVAARAGMGETISGASTNEVVQMISSVQIPLVGVYGRAGLPSEAEAVETLTPIAQTWTNAHIGVSAAFDGYKVWPQVPGIDMASVRKEELVRTRGIELKGTPELLGEAVTMAPSNIWWTEATISVKLTGKAVDSLSASLKGKSYVR